MIRCGIVEENEAMLTRFMGGLNREIQTILEYNVYNNITRLFHLACKDEREVQDRQSLARTNFSAGRSSSWTSRASSSSNAQAPPSVATSSRDTRKKAQPPLSAKSTPAGPAQSSSSSMASTGHTSHIICRRCKGRGDEDINTIVTPTAPAAIHTGPITRARARQLNYQVLSFLGNDSNVHENMMLPKLDTFVLLTNEGPSLEKDEHWSKNKHGDDGMRKGNKNGVTSDDFRTLKPP